jgi:hypothetical protein
VIILKKSVAFNRMSRLALCDRAKLFAVPRNVYSCLSYYLEKQVLIGRLMKM